MRNEHAGLRLALAGLAACALLQAFTLTSLASQRRQIASLQSIGAAAEARGSHGRRLHQVTAAAARHLLRRPEAAAPTPALA